MTYRTVPPTPELWLSEPVLESKPSESLNHKFSLSEVICLMDAWQMAGKGAYVAEHLFGTYLNIRALSSFSF